MRFSNKQKGILALIGLAISYASFGFFTRYLISVKFGFFQQLYLRIFAGLIFGFLIFGRKINLKKLKKVSLSEWGLLTFRAVSYYLLGAAMFNQAVLLTKISTVSFISSLPMTAILGFLILREKITFKKILYISLSFIGVVIISVKSLSNVFVWGPGEILALLSTTFVSLSIVFRRFQTKLLTNLEITQIILFIAFIFLLIASIGTGESVLTNNWNWQVFLMVLLTGVANVAMIFFTNYGFEHVENSMASNILTLEMVFAVIIGLLIYKEMPTARDFFGGLLILISVIQMNKLE